MTRLTEERSVEELLDEREVARRLDVSIPTVRFWRRAGTGPQSQKIGGWLVRYAPDEVERVRAERLLRDRERGARREATRTRRELRERLREAEKGLDGAFEPEKSLRIDRALTELEEKREVREGETDDTL
jgi:DNA-binding transcriptional MerR regulator